MLLHLENPKLLAKSLIMLDNTGVIWQCAFFKKETFHCYRLKIGKEPILQPRNKKSGKYHVNTQGTLVG